MLEAEASVTVGSPSEGRNTGEWITGKAGRELLPRGSIRARFQTEALTVGTGAGTAMTLDFTGRAIGAYVLAGPDAALLEASIDGGPFQKSDLYHRYSRGLNYPRTVLFFTDLSPGKHTLKLRIAARPGNQAGGTRAAILQFVVNE